MGNLTEKEFCEHVRGCLLKNKLEDLKYWKKELQQVINDYGEEVRNKKSNGFYWYESAKFNVEAIEKKIDLLRKAPCDEIFVIGKDSEAVSQEVKDFLQMWHQNMMKSEEKRKQILDLLRRGYSYQSLVIEYEKYQKNGQLLGSNYKANLEMAGAGDHYKKILDNWDSNLEAAWSNPIESKPNINVTPHDSFHDAGGLYIEELQTQTNTQVEEIIEDLVFSEDGSLVGGMEISSIDNKEEDEFHNLQFSEDGSIKNADKADAPEEMKTDDLEGFNFNEDGSINTYAAEEEEIALDKLLNSNEIDEIYRNEVSIEKVNFENIDFTETFLQEEKDIIDKEYKVLKVNELLDNLEEIEEIFQANVLDKEEYQKEKANLIQQIIKLHEPNDAKWKYGQHLIDRAANLIETGDLEGGENALQKARIWTEHVSSEWKNYLDDYKKWEMNEGKRVTPIHIMITNDKGSFDSIIYVENEDYMNNLSKELAKLKGAFNPSLMQVGHPGDISRQTPNEILYGYGWNDSAGGPGPSYDKKKSTKPNKVLRTGKFTKPDTFRLTGKKY